MMATINKDWFGPNFPFVTNTSVFGRQSGERIIKNDLLQLLLTIPGERVGRPTFGTALRSFTFEQLTSNDIYDLKNNIKYSIAKFEPRVSVEELLLDPDPDENLLRIRLVVSLKDNPSVQFVIDRQLLLSRG